MGCGVIVEDRIDRMVIVSVTEKIRRLELKVCATATAAYPKIEVVLPGGWTCRLHEDQRHECDFGVWVLAHCLIRAISGGSMRPRWARRVL